MTYLIHEDNIERLEKKLTRIKNKCAKYDLEFKYNKLGEVYKKVVVDEVERVARFIEVEVFGEVKKEGWEFIATLEHTEKGNIIRAFKTDVQIPDRFRNCKAVCEHCNTIRQRKQTYIIRNIESGEFKQVGGGCLYEYTHVLSADMIASYISYFNEMIEAENVTTSGSRLHAYFPVAEILQYYVEVTKQFGFMNAKSWECPTFVKGLNFYKAHYGTEHDPNVLREMEEIHFNAYTEESAEKVRKMLEWVLVQDDPDNDYIHNLKVICSNEYCRWKDLPILASFPNSYDREMKYVADNLAREAENSRKVEISKWLGNVGEKLSIVCKSAKLVTTFENQFGLSYLYEFETEDGNIVNWFASSRVEAIQDVIGVKGTVKKQELYRGIKQTTLTRCKVTYREDSPMNQKC